MHDSLGVRVLKGARNLARQPHCLLHRQRPIALQTVPQRLSGDIRHDVIQEAACVARVVQRQDVGVLQTGGDLDLAQKALRAHRHGQLWAQHFERDGSIMFQVTGEIHRGHSAMAEFAVDRVAPMQRGLQTGEQVGQVGSRGLRRLHHRASARAR